MNNQLSAEEIQKIERLWTLRRQAVELLGEVNDEFLLDPGGAVLFFDAGFSEQVNDVVSEIKALSVDRSEF